MPHDLHSVHTLRSFIALLTVLLTTTLPSGDAKASDRDVLWDALRNGKAIALIRHALAPGYSDPQNFTLNQCETQRNLSQEGRAQAKAIGARMRSQGITHAAVYTSQWCRCRDTADLLELGKAKDLAILNSFFEHRERRDPQTKKLLEWLGQQTNQPPIILVTHQVNISAFTGQATSSGEIVFVKFPIGSDVTVLGAIEP